MTRRPTWLAVLAAALALVTAVSAQPPRTRDAIGPDDVRRVNDWLKGMQGGPAFDPAALKQALELLQKNPLLAQQLRDFQKQHPNPDAKQLQQFAEQLKQSPVLQNEKAQADLKQFAETMGGLPPVPNLPNIGGLEGKYGGPGIELKPGGFKPPTGGLPDATQLPNLPSGTPPTGPIGVPFTPDGPPSPGKLPRVPPLPRGQWPGATGSAELPKSPGVSAQQQQQFQKMAGWWEKNVGPLKDSPAIQQLMVDFAAGSGNSSGKGNTFAGLFADEKGGETSLGKLADVNTGVSGWKFPDLGIGKPDISWGGAPDFGGPAAPSGASVGGFGVGGESSWLSVALLAAAAGVGLLLWWLWPKLATGRAGEPRPLTGLGPWPVDPRTIADRAALVTAFEYLSVLRCGTGAKVWNHVTIAAELRRAVPDVGELADPLARLYAVARYTPADEPLADADLAEARGHLCRLAGVAS